MKNFFYIFLFTFIPLIIFANELDEELIDNPTHQRSGHEQSRKAKTAATTTAKPAPTLASIPKPIEIKKFFLKFRHSSALSHPVKDGEIVGVAGGYSGGIGAGGSAARTGRISYSGGVVMVEWRRWINP